MTAHLIQFPKKLRRAPTRRIALTEGRVAALTGEGFVLDSRQASLAVRITGAGTKTYVYQRKIKGRLTRIALGKCNAMRLDDARAAVARFNGEVALGKDLRAERAQARCDPKRLSLDDAFMRFKGLKKRRASTLRDYETLWRLHVPASLKAKAVADMTGGDLEILKSRIESNRSGRVRADGTSGKLRSSGKSRTAGKVLTLLGAVLNKGGRWADNPVREIARPQINIRTRRLATPEIAAVLSVLEASRGDLFTDLIAIALLTGARRGALCAMRWENLHLDDGVWLVPATWSKNGKEVAVALPAKAVEILNNRSEVRDGAGWVWPSELSKTGHVVNPEKPLKRVLSAAGVAPVSMHDLRRTLGSRLAMTGAGVGTISAALGHVSPQSAKAYIHIDVAHARAAMEKALGQEKKNSD